MARKLIVSAVALLFGLTIWLVLQYRDALSQPLIKNTLIVDIEKGDSFARVTQKLFTDHGLTIAPYWFKVYAYVQQATNKLKVGEYELTSNLTIPQVLNIFTEGKCKKYSVTFPEGLSLKELLQILEVQNNLKLIISKDQHNLIPSLVGMRENNAEGWFFPDTYFFEKNATDISILKRAYTRMQDVLAQEWQTKDADLPYKTPYEALTMASIVEKETGSKSERSRIAGVFVRRLKIGMLLQTDPTVIYGMGEKYKGNIRLSDLTTPTDYNTYVIKGLPPTPIAMPGRDAINAALHPNKDDNSLYFVAKGDGSHQFSVSLADHNHAVNVFQKHQK